MLIGADLFWKTLKPEKIDLGKHSPVLQNSEFSWMVTGNFKALNNFTSSCNLSIIINLHNDIQKFWNIEENYDYQPKFGIEEQECENHFINTYSRKEDGKFVFQIPFKKSPTCLGNSVNSALSRFQNLEKKLAYNLSLKNSYIQFMNEYKILGHMKKIEKCIDNTHCYYFPHHTVLKTDSLTTKCRVVFDGSTVTDNGLSTNNIQYIGSIQDDLMSILIRFREHAYVFMTDICKMYRQIEIHEEQRQYQRIFWREDSKRDLEVYELNTVTYGTASAPYLATRCIKQLSKDNSKKFKLASKIISRDFYIDDLISGADTIERAANLISQISKILASGHFNLTKWCSNKPQVLKNVQTTDQISNYINIGETTDTKLLGLQWNIMSDKLKFKSSQVKQYKITRRSILASIAKTLDPLGLLAPAIAIKIIMQELWTLKFGWDDDVPSHIKAKWLLFNSNLQHLDNFSIPRFAFCKNPVFVELHGFSDACQNAYGACIYARCTNTENQISVNLLCAKSRVAPLKALSVPRLELSGALVLARLMKKILSSLTIVNIQCHYWTDSQVVLAWLKNNSRLFHIFVANRLSEIQNLTNIENWYHVRTHENPADIISRGMQLHELNESTLWYKGPRWLSEPRDTWQSSYALITDSYIPERKLLVNTVWLKTINEDLISKRFFTQ